MPARINNPRAAEQLRREYTVQGDRLNLQVDDIVVPVAIVSDLTAGSGGVPVVRRAHASFYQAGVAGEYGVWRLEVPSGYIVVVNRVLVQLTASGWCKVHFGSSFAVAPTNVVLKQYMDGRLRAQGLLPAVNLAHDTQAGVLAAPVMYLQGTTAPGTLTPTEWLFGREDGYVDFIEFQAPVINTAVTGFMEWDEIPLF